MPRYKVAMNERYFDCLLSLLDFHKEVNARAFEGINQLATNPIIYEKVLQLDNAQDNFSWGQIFDSTNVHKMLYSLEIVESIIVKDQNIMETHAWIKRFLELGGLEEFQSKLKSALEQFGGNTQISDKKKYVDQLLKLIRIFVMTSRQTPQKD